MARKFAEIAFTPKVKAVQERNGSRRAYGRLEEGEPTGDRLDEDAIAFIAERDGFYLRSVGEGGWPYVQHRGGPRGFLRVLDDKTLGFADFAGNKQFVTTGNLDHDGRAFLFLMDYANRRRLKIWVRARVLEAKDAPDLARRLAVPGYKARIERLFLLTVEAFDWNCPQHITPRFTVMELGPSVEALRDRIARLERENRALKAASAGAAVT
ncbi:MAG: pyridoxamine 5'-phosphate oxidase family protein [Alphaproteobacteria bacterium]